MDPDRFDFGAIAIAKLGSRRAALRAVAAGALAAGLGALRGRRASAASGANRKCSRDSECDTGICYKTGKCKQNGKLTGACRCSCDALDCPGTKVCCDLGGNVKLCRVAPTQGPCRFDTDCCFSICRQGTCCRPVGGTCGIDSNCCSGNCSVNICV